MNNQEPLVYCFEYAANSNLYEFLANNYDISDFADVARLANNIEFNILRLLKRI